MFYNTLITSIIGDYGLEGLYDSIIKTSSIGFSYTGLFVNLGDCFILLFLMSSYLVYTYFFKNNDRRVYDFAVGPMGILLLYVLTVFGFMPWLESGASFRLLYYPVRFSPIFVYFWLKKMYGNKLTRYFFVTIIILTSFIGILGLYSSPLMNTSNPQVTNSHYISAIYYLKYYDESIVQGYSQWFSISYVGPQVLGYSNYLDVRGDVIFNSIIRYYQLSGLNTSHYVVIQEPDIINANRLAIAGDLLFKTKIKHIGHSNYNLCYNNKNTLIYLLKSL